MLHILYIVNTYTIYMTYIYLYLYLYTWINVREEANLDEGR